ncbi:MAG: FAD-dependent oxidoreductase, partial [Betaproteobacteria bacterium]|nr:FAD-dependent oxidoreductase [Betaproteobacteria bacterium]
MAGGRVVVVGAGIAGLVSALRLAHAGMEVQVVEAAPHAGGKIRQLSAGGAQIDSGPTVFTMRWIFDQIYQAVGTRLEAQLHIDPLPVIARHAWSDGSVLDLFADQERSVAAVREFAGPAEADRFVQFCATARRVYDELEGPFIRSPSPSAAQMMGRLGARGLGVLMGLGPTRSLWDSLGRHFSDPRMRQLFARYATYCGSSPWEAPATLMLIAQVEMDGVWAIRGGMYALVQNLQSLAQARGVQFHFNTPCQRIDVQGGAVRAVECGKDLRLPADAVVFNGDVAALRAGSMTNSRVRSSARPLPA